MTTYILIFIILFIFYSSSNLYSKGLESFLFCFSFLILFLLIGFRLKIGGDWGTYEDMYNHLYAQFSYSDIYKKFLNLELKEPLFAYLNVFANKTHLLPDIVAFMFIPEEIHKTAPGYLVVNIVSAFIFTIGAFFFISRFENKFFAIIIFFPIAILTGMGFTRQSICLGFLFYILSVSYFSIFRIYLFASIATLFHTSAILFVGIAAFKNRIMFFLYLILIPTTAYLVMNSQMYIDFVTGPKILTYLYSPQFNSPIGSLFRNFITFISTILFFIFGSKFKLSINEYLFWLTYCVIGFILYFSVFYNTVIIDRLLIYFFPISIFVLSKLHEIINNKFKILFGVFCSFIISTYMIIWFIYANNSFAWLPYNFFIFDL